MKSKEKPRTNMKIKEKKLKNPRVPGQDQAELRGKLHKPIEKLFEYRSGFVFLFL